MPIEWGREAAWPPASIASALPLYRESLAWWSGDRDELVAVSQGASGVTGLKVRPSQLAGGLYGTAGRLLWGRPQLGTAYRFHVPAAKDVSTISADMVMADPPSFKIEDGKAVQSRLDDIVEQAGIPSVLREAAELASAAGGAFIRTHVDVDVAEVPIAEAMLPDNAVPEFFGPFLRAVTFWRVVGDHGEHEARLRHLERHEMVDGTCRVFHELRSGTATTLGRLVPLTEGDDECRRLARLVDESGSIDVGIPMLDVVYWPNMRPHPLLRGSQLGRSDYVGAIEPMSALDEAWSSLMRDIRLSKARIFIPAHYLTSLGLGKGAAWDPEQEVYHALQMQPEKGESGITSQQFVIRVDEHERVMANAMRQIMSAAGLDAHDVDGEQGPMQTATQVQSKGKRARGSRGAKISYATDPVRRLALVLLHLDAVHYQGRAVGRDELSVEWPDAAAPDIETLARTIQLLDAGAAVSTETKIRMLHPDWDDTAVLDEVRKITEGAAPIELEDPGSFRGEDDGEQGDGDGGQAAGEPDDEVPPVRPGAEDDPDAVRPPRPPR